MGNNGPTYRFQKPSSSSQAFSPLKCFEIQCIIREKITTMLKVRDIWIPIDIAIRNCCSQFYKLKLNNRIKDGDHILKISSFSKDFHMFCWLYCIDLYGHIFWRYASRSDMDYNIQR
jgi:hypothetical protein